MERPFEAYRGDEPYVFICYAHDDQAVVYPEITWLHEQGVKVWYDEGISPGEEWSEELGRAIDNADRFLYFVTPNSVSSRNCRNELHFAQNHGKSVLAIYLEETELPAGVELAIGASQAIVRSDLPEAAFRTKLHKAIGPETSSTGLASTPYRGTSPSKRRWAFGALIALACALAITYAMVELSEAAFDRSVAVSLFDGAGDEVATFANALANDLKGVMAGYQELRVLSGDRAREASYLVTGNVQQEVDGQPRRVRVDLSRRVDGVTVWSQVFDMASAEADGLPSLVGRFLRHQIIQDHECTSVRLMSNSREAADYYCAAMDENYRNANQVGDGDINLQFVHAQRALELDPTIAAAQLYVANAYTFFYWSGQMSREEASTRAHSALDAGLALAPDEPKLLFYRGNVLMKLDLAYDAAEKSFRRAIAHDPLHPLVRWQYAALGELALRRGHIETAIEDYERALRVFDSDMRIFSEYAIVLMIAGRVADALEAIEATQRFRTSDRAHRSDVLYAQGLLQLNRTAEANAVIDRIVRVPSMASGSFVLLLLAAGRETEASEMLRGLLQRERPPAMELAMAYLYLDQAVALEWLHRAIDEPPYLLALRATPLWDPVRSDPRWAAVMTHLETAEAKGRAKHSGGG